MIFEPLTRRFGGYIFDCDGTLADSMVVHHRAWLAALAAHGATFDFDWELFTSRAGMSVPNTVRELNRQFGLSLDPDGVTRSQRDEYQRFLPTVQPIIEVVELARQVASSSPVSVASGGERDIIERTLELLDLRQTFPIVVTAQDVTHGKPAPDMFLLAAERMGVRPEDCVVFEDAVLGLEAAKRAGMASVLVRSPNVR
ncbi:MAG TPA: HAD-IA family hydrolase [Polyangiaceae bacterium]|nr:HAD-IA family hydrolase [Polyangiaceae bacterium]